MLSGLDAGAIDFVQKPTALATEKVFDVAEELVAKVTAAAGAPAARAAASQPLACTPLADHDAFRTAIVCSSSASPPAGRRA